MIKKMTVEEFSKFIWDNIDEGVGFDFYEEFDEKSEDASGSYRVEGIRFADAMMVLANWYGGGGAYFCYETEWDNDPGEFINEFAHYLTDNGFKDSVWVEVKV